MTYHQYTVHVQYKKNIREDEDGSRAIKSEDSFDVVAPSREIAQIAVASETQSPIQEFIGVHKWKKVRSTDVEIGDVPFYDKSSVFKRVKIRITCDILGCHVGKPVEIDGTIYPVCLRCKDLVRSIIPDYEDFLSLYTYHERC